MIWFIYGAPRTGNFYNYSNFCRDRLNFDPKQGCPDRCPLVAAITDNVSDYSHNQLFRLAVIGG